MASDLSEAIRARLLADALTTIRTDEPAMHGMNCAIRYAEALKDVLDLCDEAEAMPEDQRREWCAPTPLAIRRRIARTLGVGGEQT